MADPNDFVDPIDVAAAGKLTADLLQYAEEETHLPEGGGMVTRGYIIAAYKAAYDVLMKELPPAPQALVNILAAEVVKHIIRMETPKEKQ